ncbi:hypothetical protein NU08_0874 [Flavobacterium anhuiense]|uniref:Uncharacterized protein n=1 Tax=Flavobacterium anhuiense TaxID=459526 RepID=A0A444W3A2_9FLAO|nr:hypothetical protein [Flavobacterium anhuiense]RYJ40118.1 hypothetical protein NU08_0874 [Flavobacterium anhuiense]
MKNNTSTLADFEVEKIDLKTQKIIRGGGTDSTNPSTSDPLKTNGGGNG